MRSLGAFSVSSSRPVCPRNSIRYTYSVVLTPAHAVPARVGREVVSHFWERGNLHPDCPRGWEKRKPWEIQIGRPGLAGTKVKLLLLAAQPPDFLPPRGLRAAAGPFACWNPNPASSLRHAR